MSVPPDQIPPLPRVASPPGWSWHYFRIRYLPAVASSLAIVTGVWLWTMNLPELAGGGVTSGNSRQVETASTPEYQAGKPIATNVLDSQAVLTNGNLSFGGGL